MKRLDAHRLWVTYVVSAILYLMHKMEARFPWDPANPDRYPDWHRSMPGLLVSHEPFDTMLNMGITFCVHGAVALTILWLLHRAFEASTQVHPRLWARIFVIAFAVLWLFVADFETHHIRKLLVEHRYFPGGVFATLYCLWMFFVLLPRMLGYHTTALNAHDRSVSFARLEGAASQ